MQSLVWRAMTDGAVGFSTGLQYVPGTYAAQPEIIELARVAANAGGLYASHMRNEGTALEQAIAETHPRSAKPPARRVEISHLKVDSPSRWGASAKALALIDAARARGLDVRGGSVRLHRRELDARDPLPVVGARRRPGKDRRAAERPGHLGRDQDGDGGAARRARTLRPVLRRRRRGAIGRVAERPVDEADRREAHRAATPPTRSSRRRAR